MVWHSGVNVENASRRLTNISRLILGKVAIWMLGINGTKHMARKRHFFKNSFTSNCASCMPNVLSFRNIFQHHGKVHFHTVRDSNVWDGKLHEMSRLIHDRKYIIFFHHPINFCVYPCMGKRSMNIVNEKFQGVISSALSSTKSFNESRVWTMYLAKTGKSWKKYFPTFAVFLLTISYVFYPCLWFVFDW